MSIAAAGASNKVRGIALEREGERLVLGLAGTDYRLHLVVDGGAAIVVGKAVVGTICARARRVDVIDAGGRYIEPVYGRPRRVQGSVVAVDAGVNTLTVHGGCAVVCELVAGQRAGDFCVGQMVSFDVERGAWFSLD